MRRARLGFQFVPGSGGRVDDPALVVRLSPVGVEVVDGLVEVVGGGVDAGLLASPAEGDVGELAASAAGEDVGAIDGGALGSMNRERVAVVEVLGVEPVACDAHVSSVAGVCVQVVVIYSGDGESFAGDDPGARVGGEGDELVADGIPASGCDLDVVAVEMAELIPVVAGEAVEVGDVGASPGEEGAVSTGPALQSKRVPAFATPAR